MLKCKILLMFLLFFSAEIYSAENIGMDEILCLDSAGEDLETRRQILEAFNVLKENKVGKCLLRGIKKYCGGRKILIIPGLYNRFQHPIDMSNLLCIELNFNISAPSLQYIGGREEKERPLDLTLFHELLHYLHFLMNKEEYLLGLNDRVFEEQKQSVFEVLKCFFDISEDDVDWVMKNMSNWTQDRNRLFPGEGEKKVFLLEELRTIWGDPDSPCVFKRISETAYLIEKNRSDLIRIGYTDEDYTQVFRERVGSNEDIGNRIIQQITAKIGDVSVECECLQCSFRNRCCC